MRHQYLLGVAIVALALPAAASAQETTAAIRGSVTFNGAPVAGATVEAVETSTGTRESATTKADGGFAFNGLRPGGPYTVTVTSPNGNKTVTDIFTVVQQTFSLPIELSATATGQGATTPTDTGAPADAASTGDIVVTASRIKGAGTRSDGPQTIFNQADVAKVASVNRDIRDVEKRDPFATLDLSNTGSRGGAVIFAGVNPRFNKFTINGVTVGDTFGLNQDASPTNRGPIPYDAIGQVSLSIAPYDFRQSGFQGGVIDVILKSGTNDFHGTGFYSENTNGLSGSRIGSNVTVNPNFISRTYGATLSGPIIKDKLFFSVTAERNTDPRPFSTLLSSYSSVGVSITQPLIDNINAITAAKYPTVVPGNTLGLNPRKDEKIVAQINANLSDRQKLSLSYINSYDLLDSQNNTTVSATAPKYGLSSNAYALSELLRAGIVQLNSQWSDNFDTEARAIYKRTVRGQEPLQGRPSGQLGVCNDNVTAGSLTACTSGSPIIYFGPDVSRQTNQLNFDTKEASLLGRYRAGDHEVKLLVDVTQNHTFNNFVQYSLGSWYFDSLNDYRNGLADTLTYAAPVSNPAANFQYTQFAFGAQDDWKVTPSLTFTYGVRESIYSQNQQPIFDPYFLARENFSNTKTYKGLEVTEPRISFAFSPVVGTFQHLRLRGGAGIFAGGTPDIYLSNSFSNTITTSQLTFQRAAAATAPGQANVATCTNAAIPTAVCTAALNNVTGTVSPLVTAYLSNPANAAGLPLANVGALDPNFRIPRELKATLSADYTIFGINFGADYYFSKTIDGVYFTDGRSVVIGTLPDGRPRYGNVAGPAGFTDNNYDVILRNDHAGRSHIGVVRFDKTFDFGLNVGGSYTLQDVRDVSDATSSTLNSNYANQIYANPNIPVLGTSDNQTKWEFKYSLGYSHAFYRDYKTTIQFFGDTKAGRPFSYTDFLTSGNNRSPVTGAVLANSTNLLYVPTGPNDPLVSYGDANVTVNGVATVVTAAQTQAALDNYINNSVLAKYRGQISAKNIDRSRANTRVDLHLEQELPTFVGKSRISVFADITDLPNLLNHNWGGLRQLAFPYGATLVTVQCLTTAGNANNAGVVATTSSQPCAQYRYSAYTNPSTSAVNITQSLYAIRIGARFTF